MLKQNKILNSCVIVCMLFVSLQKNTAQSLPSKNCIAELKVEKNTDVKSIFNNKVEYILKLTNTTISTVKYKIKVDDKENYCNQHLHNLSKRNVKLVLKKQINKSSKLNSIVLSENKSLLNEVTLKPNDVYTFKVQLKPTKDTGIQKWNCTHINIYSESCNKVVASSSLKTYIPNPNLK